MERFRKYLQSTYHISNADWNSAMDCFQMAMVPRKEFFVRSGKICRALGFIEEGVIRYCRFEENGDSTTCYFSSENDFVGDPESFFLQKPSEINLEAITDCTLVIIPYENQRRLNDLPFSPEISADIDRKVVKKLFEQREFQMNRDAASKYEEFMKRYPHILQRVPLAYIASFLGITQQSLSRLRKQHS